MKRRVVGLVTVLLILHAAAFAVATSAQAGLHPRDVEPDHPLQPSGVQPDHLLRSSDGLSGIAAQVENGTPPVEPDDVLLEIDVYGNGTAIWRIAYWIRLDDPATDAAFQGLQENLRGGSAATSEAFYDRIRESIEAAEETTGREMSGTDFAVDTTVRQIPREYGVVTYRFLWDGFTTASDRRISVGDALGGFFIGPGERLSISWPEDYELAEIDPAPDTEREGTVVWRGPTRFGPDGPQIVLTDSGWLDFPVPLLGGIVVVIVLLAVVGLVRRYGGAPLAPLKTVLVGEEREGAELLSNEERVLRLLENNGGRAKQQHVADELGWTETKTSHVVSTLREEGRIHSFRLGRENVLILSDSRDVQQTGR